MINKIKHAIFVITMIVTMSATVAAQPLNTDQTTIVNLSHRENVEEMSYGYDYGETFECTFYGPDVGSITALGNEVYEGCIAVDPNVIPLGSTVYIEFPPGYEYLNGNFYACDTGGMIYGNTIDVFLNMSEAELNDLGRITVTVYR